MDDMDDIDFSDLVSPQQYAEEQSSSGSVEAAEPQPNVILANPLAGSYHYYFLSPPKVDGKILRFVTVKQPNQAHIDAYVKGDVATRRELLAALCGTHPAVIAALIWPDSKALHQIFSDIIPEFLKD